MNNPFFIDYKLPYDAVPFSKFKAEHFIPAVKKSIELAINRINQTNKTNKWLKLNDTVTLEIDGLGKLENKIYMENENE